MSKNLNWLILNVKYYIYSMKIVNRNLCINTINIVLGKKFLTEKYIYYKTCEYDKFNIEWSNWLNQLMSSIKIISETSLICNK